MFCYIFYFYIIYFPGYWFVWELNLRSVLCAEYFLLLQYARRHVKTWSRRNRKLRLEVLSSSRATLHWLLKIYVSLSKTIFCKRLYFCFSRFLFGQVDSFPLGFVQPARYVCLRVCVASRIWVCSLCVMRMCLYSVLLFIWTARRWLIAIYDGDDEEK